MSDTHDDPISSVHPSYGEADEIWQTVEDVCAGGRCVKRGNERYLTQLEGQSDKEYQAFKDRATFVNFTKRTRESMCGMLMRKPPEITFTSDDIERLSENVTLEGHTIKDWVRLVCDQAVSTGRSATVIDWSSQLERPYFAHYKARDVLNWASTRSAGSEKLVFLSVREIDEVLEEFIVEEVIKIRRYWLDESGYVQSDLWVQTRGEGTGNEAGEVRFMEDTDARVQMARSGKPLTCIPAEFHNATHLGPEIGEAPLGDIAEINISHYRSSADLENGRHICGLPTPYGTGVDIGKGDLKLGSSNGWFSDEPNAKFGFIEFKGEGLGALTTALKEKESQMAVLGARLLFNDSNDAEAFETVQLRATSETAALSNISGTLSATLTRALQWFHWWTQTDATEPDQVEASVILSKDFTASQMAPTMLTALTSAYQMGSISTETYFHQLKQGEIYPPDWDMEQEKRSISQQAISAPVITAPGKPPTDET